MTKPIVEFSQAISALNKEKKYQEAIRFFKDGKSEFTDEEISNHDSLSSAMITALRHSENLEHAFKYIDHYKIAVDEHASEYVLNSYGWLLYSKLKEENSFVERPEMDSEPAIDEDLSGEQKAYSDRGKSEVIKKIENLLPLLLNFKNEFSETVFSRLFTSVLQSEKKKGNRNWEFIMEFCNLFTPDQLNTECRTIEVMIKGELKPMELASDKEYWYANQTAATLKLEKYQECFDLSKAALGAFEKFHYSNDVWFARRMALSKKHLGKIKEAIADLEKLYQKNKLWFLQKDLAIFYHENKENEKSLKYAVEALQNIGDLKYKVELIYLVGDLLNSKNDKEWAFKHFSFANLMRQQEGWNIPPKLQSALEKFSEKIPVEKLPIIKNELKKFWASQQTSKAKQAVSV